MKKIISIALIAVLALALLAGCGSSAAPATTTAPASEAPAELSGTVATDGSTSMEKVIGALGEAFMEQNKGVTFTYNPTGSGSGITAVGEGRCDIGLSSRALKDDEKASGLKETVLALDGIAPTEDTVKDGSYVIQRPFVLVTKDGAELSAAAQAFFDYATSADAADLTGEGTTIKVTFPK